jgi:dGTPase
MDRVYMHPETIRNSQRGKRMLSELFREYVRDPRLLPWKYQRRIEHEGLHRVVCDYIAGMTDRFFVDQYRRTFLDVPVY